MQDRIVLPISPRAWISFRSGKGGDSAYWFIPLVCTRRDLMTGVAEDKGNPCEEFENTGYCKHTLSKKARQNKANIEKYNKYRMDLYHLAKYADLQISICGVAVYFYFPVPKRWTKKKKLEMHGQLKLSKSDCSNLIKGAEDSLVGKDENIAHYGGLGKYWFHPDKVEAILKEGYIEFLLNQPVYNPFNVVFIHQNSPLEMESIESRREKRKARKEELKEQRKVEAPRKKPKPLKLLPQKKLFKREDKIK